MCSLVLSKQFYRKRSRGKKFSNLHQKFKKIKKYYYFLKLAMFIMRIEASLHEIEIAFIMFPKKLPNLNFAAKSFCIKLQWSCHEKALWREKKVEVLSLSLLTLSVCLFDLSLFLHLSLFFSFSLSPSWISFSNYMWSSRQKKKRMCSSGEIPHTLYSSSKLEYKQVLTTIFYKSRFLPLSPHIFFYLSIPPFSLHLCLSITESPLLYIFLYIPLYLSCSYHQISRPFL